MTKHRKYRHHKVCKASSHVVGNHVTVKATCPIKSKKVVVKAPCKKAHVKPPKKHNVPKVCKGLKGRSLTQCKRILHKKYTV